MNIEYTHTEEERRRSEEQGEELMLNHWGPQFMALLNNPNLSDEELDRMFPDDKRRKAQKAEEALLKQSLHPAD
jgi:hypothetical protein